MIIYKITNMVNGKAYIGQTTRPLKERIKEHYSKDKSLLYKAVKKYGKSNFEVEIICKCSSLKELGSKEKFFINKLRTLVPNGYNVSEGGENTVHSEETLKKMSEKKRGKLHPLFGKKRSSKVKKLISESKKGTKISEETRLKISIAHKGTKKTSEHRLKISQSLKGKKKTREHSEKIAKSLGTKILCNETGEIFSSIKEASVWLNVNPNAIKWSLSKPGRKCKGYTFMALPGQP